MRERIAFFGASITQQGEGYASHFARMNPGFEYSLHGYGSMHLNDAGICRIDDVLAARPTWCFVDWFSTYYIKEKENSPSEIKQYIDTVVHRFYEAGVKLLFLMFPETVNDKTDIFAEIRNYLGELNVPLVDLSGAFDDIESVLRDGIHTTPFGSSEYARHINLAFTGLRDSGIPENYPARNKYCDVRWFDINSVVQNSIVFRGDAEILGISQIIGPYTGLLSINGETLNNWDRWCYYEREMVNLRFEVKGTSEVKVLQDDFDRSTCEHQADWGTKKLLKLMRCFYVGDSLAVSSVS